MATAGFLAWSPTIALLLLATYPTPSKKEMSQKVSKSSPNQVSCTAKVDSRQGNSVH